MSIRPENEEIGSGEGEVAHSLTLLFRIIHNSQATSLY